MTAEVELQPCKMNHSSKRTMKQGINRYLCFHVSNISVIPTCPSLMAWSRASPSMTSGSDSRNRTISTFWFFTANCSANWPLWSIVLMSRFSFSCWSSEILVNFMLCRPFAPAVEWRKAFTFSSCTPCTSPSRTRSKNCFNSGAPCRAYVLTILNKTSSIMSIGCPKHNCRFLRKTGQNRKGNCNRIMKKLTLLWKENLWRLQTQDFFLSTITVNYCVSRCVQIDKETDNARFSDRHHKFQNGWVDTTNAPFFSSRFAIYFTTKKHP